MVDVIDPHRTCPYCGGASPPTQVITGEPDGYRCAAIKCPGLYAEDRDGSIHRQRQLLARKQPWST